MPAQNERGVAMEIDGGRRFGGRRGRHGGEAGPSREDGHGFRPLPRSDSLLVVCVAAPDVVFVRVPMAHGAGTASLNGRGRGEGLRRGDSACDSGAVAMEGEEAAFLAMDFGPCGSFELVDMRSLAADESPDLCVMNQDGLSDGGSKFIQVHVARCLACGGS